MRTGLCCLWFKVRETAVAGEETGGNTGAEEAQGSVSSSAPLNDNCTKGPNSGEIHP